MDDHAALVDHRPVTCAVWLPDTAKRQAKDGGNHASLERSEEIKERNSFAFVRNPRAAG
jgi:hypothetical protein